MTPLGKHNPLLKELAQLSHHAERQQQGRFLVEGLRALEELEASPLELEFLLVGEPGERGQRLVETARAGQIYQVDPAVLERLTPAQTSQGLLGVARLPADRTEEVLAAPSLLVCEEIADPGNLGTLLRTARASGTGGVVLLGGADPFAPKVVRSAAGALFSLPLARVSLEELRDFGLVATVVEGGDNLYTSELPARPAWLLGSEAHGLSPASQSRAQHRVTIPMRSGESLNVAICGALLMFEWVRRQEVQSTRQSPRL